MARVVLAKLALLLAIRGCSAIDDDVDAQGSCDGEASSLLQTAGTNMATRTNAPPQAEQHTLMFTTSADACKGCYDAYVPPGAFCTSFKCTTEICGAGAKGYVSAQYDDKNPAPSKDWKKCPSKASLPKSYTHDQDACMACGPSPMNHPEAAGKGKCDKCFSYHCNDMNCGTNDGYMWIYANETYGNPWTPCPTPDGEASSLLQTAGTNMATRTTAPPQAEQHTLWYTTSADACKGCYDAYVPPGAFCTSLKCTTESCGAGAKGYVSAQYDDKNPAPSKDWKKCPSKASLPKSYTHDQDACMACGPSSMNHPEAAGGKCDKCFSYHCNDMNCGTNDGYMWIYANETYGNPWTPCPTPMA